MNWLKPVTAVTTILVIFGVLGSLLVLGQTLLARPAAIGALAVLGLVVLFAVAYGAKSRQYHTTTYW